MEYNKNQYDKWHKDPANWKFGLFYYNPEDPRLFPPKRFKYFGWTINFGNPLSILFFILIATIVIAIAAFA